MAIQDAIYGKVNKKRAELEALQRDLGQAAASLRDHDAWLKDRSQQLRAITEQTQKTEARERGLRESIEQKTADLAGLEEAYARRVREN